MKITESEKLRLLSFLLQYPDEEMIGSLRKAGVEIREMLDAAECSEINGLVGYLSETPQLRLQENYTATFDLNPKNCLNLTYHIWEDRKERGEAIARFAQSYAEAGYGPATGELPDFLPAVLEFLSVEDADACRWITDEYTETLRTLKTRLEDADSPYSTVFEVLTGMFSTTGIDNTGKDYG